MMYTVTVATCRIELLIVVHCTLLTGSSSQSLIGVYAMIIILLLAIGWASETSKIS